MAALNDAILFFSPLVAITGGAVWVVRFVWSFKWSKDVRRKPIRFLAGAKWTRNKAKCWLQAEDSIQSFVIKDVAINKAGICIPPSLNDGSLAGKLKTCYTQQKLNKVFPFWFQRHTRPSDVQLREMLTDSLLIFLISGRTGRVNLFLCSLFLYDCVCTPGLLLLTFIARHEVSALKKQRFFILPQR